MPKLEYDRYLPICDICGRRIDDDEYFVVGGKIVCPQCCEVRDTSIYIDEQIDAEGMDDYEDDLPFC